MILISKVDLFEEGRIFLTYSPNLFEVWGVVPLQKSKTMPVRKKNTIFYKYSALKQSTIRTYSTIDI